MATQVTVMQPGVVSQPGVVVSQQPVQRYNSPGCVKGLGITSIVFGSITLILGIVVSSSISGGSVWIGAAPGVWGGLLIIVAGILGVCSASSQSNGCLAGFHLTFMIILTIVLFMDGIFYIIAMIFYGSCSYVNINYRRYEVCPSGRDTGLAVHGILLAITMVQWFISLIASIYGCCGTCCRSGGTGGVIIQQHQPAQAMVITSSAGQPQPMYTGNVAIQPGMVNYSQPQQVVYAGQPGTQVAYTQQQQPYAGQPGQQYVAQPYAGQPGQPYAGPQYAPQQMQEQQYPGEVKASFPNDAPPAY